MKALCLDLGTTTGWALARWTESHKEDIVSGTMPFKPQRFEGGGMRYLRFRRWLDEIKLSTFDAVFFEEVRRHSAVDAAHVYGGLMATLTSWCEAHGIPYQGVPVGTIKKHFTGKGNANKAVMLATARARGYAPEDDNEADAIALGSYVLYNAPGFKI
jgi:Holliday junction resolvasome RuvABC endonuclease subunit